VQSAGPDGAWATFDDIVALTPADR
jgi:hypothetical protein